MVLMARAELPDRDCAAGALEARKRVCVCVYDDLYGMD